MQRLVLYHAVRDTTHLSLCHGTPHATRPRTRETALARTLDAARRRCSPALQVQSACAKVPSWQWAQLEYSQPGLN